VLLKLGGARAAGLIALTIVVHRPDDEAVRTLAAEYRAHAEPSRVIDGELSWTLRTGIEYLKSFDSTDPKQALLVCLGDQPMLRLDVIQALVDAWKHGGVMAARPSYRDAPGEPGHPLLVDKSLWHLGKEMQGESGFGPLLTRHAVNVRTIIVGGSNPDVDTQDDLKNLDGQPAAAHS